MKSWIKAPRRRRWIRAEVPIDVWENRKIFTAATLVTPENRLECQGYSCSFYLFNLSPTWRERLSKDTCAWWGRIILTVFWLLDCTSVHTAHQGELSCLDLLCQIKMARPFATLALTEVSLAFVTDYLSLKLGLDSCHLTLLLDGINKSRWKNCYVRQVLIWVLDV